MELTPTTTTAPKAVQQTKTKLRSKRKYRSPVQLFFMYLLLFIVMCLMVGPFLWLLSTALKSGHENIFAYPPSFIPQDITLSNFTKVMETFPFWRYLFNSTLVAVITVLLNILLCSLAAYPLARMKFRGKNLIFLLIISTMMVPFQLVMIPIYILSLELGLQNTYGGIILPHATTAFGIFLMRQAFLTVPYELEESARMDGCNSFQIWWKIIMPLVRPSVVTLAIFTFVMSWSDFLWPLIILNDENMYTLPLGVNALAGNFSANWRLIAAGSVLSVLPIIIFFILMQRHFIDGAMKGAVKG